MTKNNTLILWILIILGVLAGLDSAKHRYAVESRNQRVEIVIDYSEAQLLANTTPRRTMDATLTQLRQAVVTTVAIMEDSLQSLVSSGVMLPPKLQGENTVLTFAPGFAGQEQRVLQNIQEKTSLTVTQPSPNTLLVNAPWLQFNGTPIGLDDQEVRTVQKSGLLVAPRLLNFTGVTEQNITWELAQTKQQCETPAGIGPLIFAGAAVLGNRPLIKVTSACLAADGLTYGSVEFAKTFGDDTLSRMAAARTVRVHSIGSDDMGAMDEPTAVDQFILGARERNIRVCYVRLFVNGVAGDSDVVHANTVYIRKIVDGLRQAGLSVGGPHPAAHPFAHDPTPSRLLRILMGLATAAGVMWLIYLFFGLSGRAYWTALIICVLVSIVLAWPQIAMKEREILALLAACTFPTLGLCAFPLPRPKKQQNPSLINIFGKAFLATVRMTLSTLAGIILIVGLLSGRLFFLKIDEFLGVKLVLLVPIVLVAAYYGFGLNSLGRRASWDAHLAQVKLSLRRLWSQPLLVGQTVLFLVALAVLAVLAMRSGNDPGIGVSAFELKFRAILGATLGVRPRTKEFLLGYPALFFALSAAAGGRFKRAIVPLLIVGTIGEASMMDTFCHLHTPLLISLIWSYLGWRIGVFIGLIVYWIVSRVPTSRDTDQDDTLEEVPAAATVTP